MKSKREKLIESKKWVEQNSTAEMISDKYTVQSDNYWFRCECGNGFRTSLNTFKFKDKHYCSVCSEKRRAKKRMLSDKEIRDSVNEHLDLEFLSHRRVNGKIKIKLKCDCGKEFESMYNSIKHFKIEKCRKCRDIENAEARRLDIKEVETYIEKYKCTLVSKSYNNDREKLRIKCECGNEFKRTLRSFKTQKHKTCEECYHEQRGTPLEEDVVKEYLNKYGLKLLSNYEKNSKKVKIKCSCGEIFRTTFNIIQSSKHKKCKSCVNTIIGDQNRKLHSKYEESFYKKVRDGYKISGKYIGAKKNILITHKKCGRDYKAIAGKILKKGTSCPFCNMTKGEEKIFNVLNELSLDFKTQKSIIGCSNVNKLIFDFIIYKDGSPKTVIEYDGEFHYKVIPNLRDFSNFLQQKKRDFIKNKFCRDNDIELIRIPYWDYNIINKYLKNLFKI